MVKSDYKRALIMLRALERGYAGHARLERRTLAGSLDFLVTSPDDRATLAAALIGTRGAKTVAKTLGTLRRDSRGQLGLMTSFDPRNVMGLDLNDMTAAVVAKLEEGCATPVLYGWLGGNRELDWAEVKKRFADAYPYCRPAETAPETPTDTAPETPTDTTPETPTDTTPETPTDTTPETPADNTPETPTDTTPETPTDTAPEAPAESTPQAPSGSQAGGGRSAASYIDIDMSAPWPGDVESLRLLFLTSPRYAPFPMQDYVFIRAGMAEETGINHCAVGVRAEDGKIVGVCYAIPMNYTPEPPPGLEGYRWIGDANRGWWVMCDSLTAE